jgi:hypothetical protein
MAYQHYAKVLEVVRDILGIVSDKKMHFGRHYGSMDGEMQDLDAKPLTKLGQLAVWCSVSMLFHEAPFKGTSSYGATQRKEGLLFLPTWFGASQRKVASHDLPMRRGKA